MSTLSVSQEEDMSVIITPRSKVKAMLAAIDDEEDSDDYSTSPLKPSNPDIRGGFSYTTLKSTDGQVRCDDDDDEPLAPRGRLAARLQAQPDKPQNPLSLTKTKSSSSSTENTERRIQRPKENQASTAREIFENVDDHERPIDRHWGNKAGKAKEGGSIPPSSPSWPPTSPAPGLFSTPCRPSPPQLDTSLMSHTDSDSGLAADSTASVRFQALITRNRSERMAKETSEAERKSKRSAQLKRKGQDAMSSHSTKMSDMSGDESENNDAAQKLTQHARPTRKASKKAIEEMNRETQRMSRNMQLAHQARTRKRITKESLFARFNYGKGNTGTVQMSSSSTPATDTEGDRHKDTPSTSPCGPGKSSEADWSAPCQKNHVQEALSAKLLNLSEELPTVSEIISQPTQSIAEGKGETPDLDVGIDSPTTNTGQKSVNPLPPLRLKLPTPSQQNTERQIDSDSDLEILPAKNSRVSRLDIFDRLPVKCVAEGRSLQTLRALAHLTSPSKLQHKLKSSMTSIEMQTTLQQRARQQAARERAEKLQDLKDRGIVIQTAEEREKDQVEVENLFDKARKEAEDIKKKERNIANINKQADSDGKELIDSSDGDDDYEEEAADDSDVDLPSSVQAEVVESIVGSDSDEEDNDSEEDDEEGVEGGHEVHTQGQVDDEASEDSAREDEDDISDHETGDMARPLRNAKKLRVNHVVEDDDDDGTEYEKVSPTTSMRCSLNVGALHLKPDIPTTSLPSMGLTQAFAATMADTEVVTHDGDNDIQEQDSMDFLESVARPNAPSLLAEDSLSVVFDSQEAATEQVDSGVPSIDIHFSQSQVQLDLTSDTHYDIATQYSEIPDPSQNVGFGASSPIAGRYMAAPPSTVDTVLLSDVAEDVVEVVKKRGRLRPRVQEVSILPDVTENDDSEDEVPLRANKDHSHDGVSAYDVMKKAAKRPSTMTDTFDKKKSGAKEMIEEQAEESEDEYAGLGGASDDDSAAEEDGEVQKMIDEGEVEVDERELAAFYADKERVTDEKAVEKLFKDINSGMLRRKRGAEFDLSDSDDHVEARRRTKRREFAKMRKALLENENVGKIAEDPKKLAFLRAIEDREDDPDLDFLEQPEETSQINAAAQKDIPSQPQAPEAAPPKRKLPLQNSIPDSANRPPPQARRTRTVKKPSTLAEIRESVSFLIEEPHTISFAHVPGSSDIEDDAPRPDENTISEPHHRPKSFIIDRISLKRAASVSTSAANLAFHNTTTITADGFKTPSLLRRATTQLTNTENYGVTAGTERAAGGGEKGDFVRRGGGKKSSVNFWTREREKGKVEKEIERERLVGRLKEREGRRDVLGVLGGGMFD